MHNSKKIVSSGFDDHDYALIIFSEYSNTIYK